MSKSPTLNRLLPTQRFAGSDDLDHEMQLDQLPVMHPFAHKQLAGFLEHDADKVRPRFQSVIAQIQEGGQLFACEPDSQRMGKARRKRRRLWASTILHQIPSWRTALANNS